MPPPIPVALCITELDRGGAELAFCELAVRLNREKFDPVVYSLRPRPENDLASCVPQLEKAGIPIHFLDIRGFGSLPAGWHKLRQLLREQKPLIFQSFLFHANLLGRLAAYVAGVPHRFCGIRVAEKQANWHLILDRWTASFVEKYVAVSQAVADFSVEIGRLPREKMVVIPNGIDCQMYSPRPGRSDSVKKRAIFVGRLHRQKGIDWLLETCPVWMPQLPDWALWIVGGGDEKQVQQYHELCEPLQDDLKNRIHWTGWRGDVPQLLAESDLFVLPSRWEGMPNVVLQAMSCGLPVLASNVEGVSEIFGPELAEFQTVPFGQTPTFSEKLLKIANNPDLAAELGTQNRIRVEEEFTFENMVRSYEELWSGT